MQWFEPGQRVYVTKPDHPLYGWSGTVWRVHIRDNDAWFEMDRNLPDHLRRFAPDDERHKMIELRPQDCEELSP